MRITRLQMRDMRRHVSLDLTLSPGLTVIKGPNEAGKTTIQRALELVLSRKVTSTQGDLELMRPWTSAFDARPVISLEFVDEEFDVTHHGKLEKQFRGAKGTVRLEVDGDVTTDPSRAEELLAELTGIPSEPFFRSTASVRHHELDDLDRDESVLRDRLQASISGGDRGTSAAKKKLERALHDLNMKGDRNPGRLKVAEDAAIRAAALVERGEAELAQLEKDRDALAVAREQRRAAEGTLAEGRSMLEKARQAERLIADRKAATERHERYREAVLTSEEIDKLQASHPSRHPLGVIKQLVERLRALDRDIAELKASLGEAIDVEFELQVPEPTWIRWAALAMVLSVGAVAGAAIGILTGTLTSIPVALLVLVALALGVGFSAYAVRQRRAAFDFRVSKQLRDDQIARRLRGRSQLESELRVKEGDFATQLQTLQLPDLPSAEDLLAREDAHVQSIEKLQARLEGFVGKQPADSLPKLRDAAAMEVEQKTAALEALGPIAREPRARERLEVEVRDSEAALEVARDGEANCRARVEANTVDAELVAAEAERLTAWREQLAALQRRSRVYQQTLTRHRDRRASHDEDGDAVSRKADEPRHRPHHRRPLPARSRRRSHARHRCLCAREGRLGAGEPAEPGHARPGLPGGSPGAGAARHRGPPAAAHLRRSVHHLRRWPRPARARPAARPGARLPGHLSHLLRSLRRRRRFGRRARGADRDGRGGRKRAGPEPGPDRNGSRRGAAREHARRPIRSG